MELQFDKEIDAILRRSGGDRAVLVGDDPPEKSGPHVDADTVAAFVDNALPDKAKRLYMEHFADCGGCRKLLTQTILMNDTAAPAAAPAAEIVGAAAVPWYSKLFRTPNLALAMGALVLTFSGVLGYLVLQDRDSQTNTVSQVAEQPLPSDPYSIGSSANAANTLANASTAANTAAPAAVNTPPPGIANSGSGPSSTLDASADDRFGGGIPEAAKPAEKPSDPVTSAPAPPPPPPGAVREEPSNMYGVTLNDAEKESKDEDVALAKKKVAVDRNRRDMPASPAKSGPSRAAGPVQMQSNQVNTQTFEMAVTRKVGGRTFENKNGAWYDRKYAGQATINVRRGTDEFTKLDSGLRKIANDLDGVVVVVWKNKAYRIQ